MEITQFAAIVVLTLLLMKLLLLPRKVTVNPVVGKARWLMAVGIAMLDLQFVLQFTLGLRAMGVTQAVLVNLLLFIPCSWTISLAIICLQKQGRFTRVDKWLGGVIWAVSIALLGTAAAIDGQPLFSDTPELHTAEVIVSGLYFLLQCHYSSSHYKNMAAMRRTLQDYYDRDMDGMLLWMQLSMLVLMVLAIMVPMLIFVQSQSLAVFSLVFFGGIFFLVDSFCGYVVSSSPRKVEKAEKAEKDKSTAEASSTPSTLNIPLSANSVLSNSIKRWIKEGGYRHNGLTMPAAADAIGVPRYQLSAWLRQHDLTYAAWMNELRIDEAKHVIKMHPEWNNESIANHCGFSDRTYFQKKFKEKTGLSPAEYGEENSHD